MQKSFLKISLLSIIFSIACVGVSLGQVTGQTSVLINNAYTYTFDNGGLIVGPSWKATNGTVNSTSVSGTTYSANVTWTVAGTGSISLSGKNDGLEGSLSVTISNCGLGSPSTSATSFSRCGTGTLTLQATAGSGGNTVRWYSAASGGTLLATGTSYTTPSESASVTFYLTTYNTTTLCESSPRYAAATSINPVPGAPTIVTAGSVCGSGNVTLTGSPSTGTVAWYSNNTSGSVGNGSLATGQTYTPSIASTTVFYMASFNSVTQCETAPVDRMPITGTVNPLPTQYTVSGGGTICSGSTGPTITLSGSQSGINYQLRLNGSNAGSPVAGNGGVINWTNQSSAGTYTVYATNSSTSCAQAMSGSASVAVNALPTQYSMGGGGTICSGATGLAITLSGSQTGVNYQLQVNGSNIGSAVGGTGGILSWSNQTLQGAYSVIATNPSTGCTQTMSSVATVSVNALPTQFAFGGGGSYCSGTTAPSVTLSGSQSGVNYQLLLNGVNSGAPLAGNTSALTWSNQTSAGTYTVLATNATTGCTQTMSGNATVVINPLPAVYSFTGGGTICAGATGPTLTLSGSEGGISYQLIRNGSSFGSAVIGNGSALTWTNQTTAGTYAVVATNPSTGCAQTMNSNASITVNPLPTQYSVGGGGPICSGSAIPTVTLSASQVGVNYQLLFNGSNLGTVVAGTGSVLTWSSPTSAGTYTIYATNPTTGCAQGMSGSVSIVINTLPTVFTTSGGGTICSGATGTTIVLSGSQTGVNYQLKVNGTNFGECSRRHRCLAELDQPGYGRNLHHRGNKCHNLLLTDYERKWERDR